MTLTPAVDDQSHRPPRTTDGPLTFKVHSRQHRGRILQIRSPRCTIGSHPRCTLRLLANGVSPFHCVIFRDDTGIFIRRWARRTTLNGASVGEARLQPGDRLNIGTVELEILHPSFMESDYTSSEPPSTCSPHGLTPEFPPSARSSTANAPADILPNAGESPPRTSPVAERRQPHNEETAPCAACGQEREEAEMAHEVYDDQEAGACSTRGQRAGVTNRNGSSQVSRIQLVRNARERANLRRHAESGYRESLDTLREELQQLKDQYAKQLAEQDRLLTHAAIAEHQIASLKAELQAARHDAAAQTKEQGRQLQQLRTHLNESVEQLLASEEKAAQLRTQLHQMRETTQSPEQGTPQAGTRTGRRSPALRQTDATAKCGASQATPSGELRRFAASNVCELAVAAMCLIIGRGAIALSDSTLATPTLAGVLAFAIGTAMFFHIGYKLWNRRSRDLPSADA